MPDTRSLTLDSPTEAVQLFGQRDVYLRMIRDALAVRLIARGDTLQIDGAAFSAAGGSGRFAGGDVRFYSAPGANAGHDADDRFVYNTSTGQLYYDADGSGAGSAQLVATLPTGSTLVASDIWVI